MGGIFCSSLRMTCGQKHRKSKVFHILVPPCFLSSRPSLGPRLLSRVVLPELFSRRSVSQLTRPHLRLIASPLSISNLEHLKHLFPIKNSNLAAHSPPPRLVSRLVFLPARGLIWINIFTVSPVYFPRRNSI